MASHRFLHIDYFTEPYDKFHNQTPLPHYRLAKDPIYGLVEGLEVISRPKDFQHLALDLLNHLKEPVSLNSTHILFVHGKAVNEMGEAGTKALEGIVAFHNDFVTPRRTKDPNCLQLR